ncbi:MAG: hypothetical protein RL702_1374 [Pseudomonadota bacterium]
MNTLILIAGAAALVASPAVAAPHSHLGKPMAHKASKARSANTRTAAARGKAYAWGMDRQMGEIVERDARGRPTRVRVEGVVYVVCSPTVGDACINPRQAGLNFGNWPLDHWPGRPASEMHRP